MLPLIPNPESLFSMFWLRVLIYVVIAVLFLVGFHFVLAIHPPRFRSKMTPADLGLSYEPVSFQTSDGITLSGWFIPSDEAIATIMICHGYPFDKGNVLPLSRFLHRDYHLFLFDFRYFGESRGRVTTVGYREAEDVLAAIRYLKDRGDLGAGIGAWGFSLGAAALLMAESDALEAVVADSSYAEIEEMIRRMFWLFPGPMKIPFVALTKLSARLFLGIDVGKRSPLKAVQQKSIPILLIHGERDQQIPVTESGKLYEASKMLGNAEFWLVPKADHGHAYALYPEEYENRVLRLYERAFALSPAQEKTPSIPPTTH